MVGGVGGWMARPQIYVRPSLDPVPLVVHGKRPQVSVKGGGGRWEEGGGGASGGRAPPLTMGRTSERARPGDHIWRVGSGGGAGWGAGPADRQSPCSK